jgi:hyperosmotically inducible periplasmic protein
MRKMRVVSLVIVAALAAPLTLAGCASSSEERAAGGTSRSASSVLDDAALTARVKTALAAAGASPLSINVTTTQGGIVQLSGFVERPEDAQRAGEIARQVKGVQRVYNDIRVVPRLG